MKSTSKYTNLGGDLMTESMRFSPFHFYSIRKDLVPFFQNGYAIVRPNPSTATECHLAAKSRCMNILAQAWEFPTKRTPFWVPIFIFVARERGCAYIYSKIRYFIILIYFITIEKEQTYGIMWFTLVWNFMAIRRILASKYIKKSIFIINSGGNS